MTTWLIIYFYFGVFTFLFLKKANKNYHLTIAENISTFLITVLLFPISIILIVKDKFFPVDFNKKHRINLFRNQINIIKNFTKHSKVKIIDDSLIRSISDFQKGNFFYDITLKHLIKTAEYFIIEGKELEKESDGSGLREDGTIVMYETIRVGWFFAMTYEFMKTIYKIDKNTQERIIEALEELSKDPIQIRGEVIKALKSNLNILWQFRIGNYFLVYQPDQENYQIILHTLSTRSELFE
ncbi:MAG: hypothetical protein IPH97_06395 [Ignavibacteriales bacterium]|nr:hypothetical protein [Ignavibacteriales bacterium]